MATPKNIEGKKFYMRTSWGKIDTLRQTPCRSGTVNGNQFYSNKEHIKNCEYLVTSDAAEIPYLRQIKQNNSKIIYVYMESPEIMIPVFNSPKNAPDILMSYIRPKQLPISTTYIQCNPCVPWFYGIKFCTKNGLLHLPQSDSYDLGKLESLTVEKKPKLLSIVCSGKSFTAGHKWRQLLTNEVKQSFGKHVDIFGFGHKPLEDKKDAIDPYIFTIVIENGSFNGYVTEKIVDALIGWSIPIYSGASDINKILGVNVPQIQFGSDPKTAVRAIKNFIRDGGIDQNQLRVMRASAMKKLNIFREIPLRLEGYQTDA